VSLLLGYSIIRIKGGGEYVIQRFIWPEFLKSFFWREGFHRKEINDAVISR